MTTHLLSLRAKRSNLDEPNVTDDPFLWLEEGEGEAALAWVREQNARTLAALEGDPRYQAMYRAALAVVTAPDRIPYPGVRGDRPGQFWHDAVAIRGLWRC